ncbi:hypothetical protein ScPMuIL_001575 [Solemya velum]
MKTVWYSPVKREDDNMAAGGIMDDEDESASLDDFHVCTSECPLIHSSCVDGHGMFVVVHIGFRRSSDASEWSHDSLPVQRRLKPFGNPSIDSGASDQRYLPPPSPGLLSTNSAWSELAYLHSRRSSGLSADYSYPSNSNRDSMSALSSSLSEHLRYLVRAFSSRTEKVRETTVQPPTPTSDSDIEDHSDINSAMSEAEEIPHRSRRLDSFIPRSPRTSKASDSESSLAVYFMDFGCCKWYLPQWINRISIPSTFEPQSKIYIFWLFLVTFAFVYNAWAIPLRSVFPYQTAENITYWLICDYICDLLYILDIVIFKPRISFLNNGLVEHDTKHTRKNYMRKKMFKFDVLSLLPLDLLYLAVGFEPWLRIPRLLKIQTFWEFYERCDQAVRSGHTVRILKTMTYMLFLIHIETCGYYAMSVYEGINTNRWVYNGEGNAYVRCFYLATKTATSIGNNPKPTNIQEYMFMTIYWVSGVFVFALLIGQIRDIVEAASHIKSVYDQRMDAVMNYAKNVNLPKDIQQKIRSWFVYQWQQHKILDETGLMNCLPKKLRTDLAIHVHFNTLSKVKLFQDCDKNLLFDLVLKLKPVLYLPGDFVCKKGEVGKEMYIVSQGHVLVMGEGDLVLATLKEGSVFGEISLLAMSSDGNRRTANVRCKGFTNLFILSKHDFELAMSDYPDASKLLKKRARRLLNQNAKIARESTSTIKTTSFEEIIKTPPETPKMVKTVLKVKMLDTFLCLKRSFYTNSSEYIGNDVPPNDFPSAQEVEDFYDEILVAHVPETIKEQEEVSPKQSPLKGLVQDDITQTVHSDDSNDSGVQMIKGQSPTDSSTTTNKSYSNKDSKESFMVDELSEIVEENQSCSQSVEQLDENNTINSPNDNEIATITTVIEVSNKVSLCKGGKTGGGSVPNRYLDNVTKDLNMTITKIGSVTAHGEIKTNSVYGDMVELDAQTSSQRLFSGKSSLGDNSVQIPPENKITCSVEVHREKSVTPTSLAEFIDGRNSVPLCNRKDSISTRSSLSDSISLCARKESNTSAKTVTSTNTVVSKKDSITSAKSLLNNNLLICDRKDLTICDSNDFTNLPLVHRKGSIISIKSSSKMKESPL